MMMVQALRPKITMNSGYIRTNGAEASAATQVSQACCSSLKRCISTPPATPNTREHDAGGQAFAGGRPENG